MKIKELSKDATIKIMIALIGAAIGLVLSIMFWSTLIESLGHMFDR